MDKVDFEQSEGPIGMWSEAKIREIAREEIAKFRETASESARSDSASVQIPRDRFREIVAQAKARTNNLGGLTIMADRISREMHDNLGLTGKQKDAIARLVSVIQEVEGYMVQNARTLVELETR